MIHDREQMTLLAAAQAVWHAYCPYSRFPVGAAILTTAGEVFAGCNVENASFGLTILCPALGRFSGNRSTGPLRIKAALIYTPTQTPTAPCGACRQVLNEFGPDAEVISVCDGSGRLETLA